MRSVVGAVVIGPVSFVIDLLRGGSQIGLECLPEATDPTAVREPATRRLKKLKKQMPIAEKLNEFSQQERNSGITSNEHGHCHYCKSAVRSKELNKAKPRISGLCVLRSFISRQSIPLWCRQSASGGISCPVKYPSRIACNV